MKIAIIGAGNVGSALARDLGFAECYDFGGDEQIDLPEQLAMVWINLANKQQQGRHIALKILKK